MAKFRRNHERKGLGFSMGKVMLFAVVLVGALWFSFRNINVLVSGGPNDKSVTYEDSSPENRYYLPEGGEGVIIHHAHFSLSYVDRYEQPEWVAYELTVQELNAPKVPRADRFNVDYDIPQNSAEHKDYSHSGYTRGHLAPAADMAFDELAMQECFYMSNISPQVRSFNNGIWRELEEQTRDWARSNKRLYIVTGPVLDDISEYIGRNRVGVPRYFYKALLDLEGNEKKAVAFLMPHETSTLHLHKYAISIDELENQIGLDLFADLIAPELEEKIESSVSLEQWSIDERRYHRRVQDWNSQ